MLEVSLRHRLGAFALEAAFAAPPGVTVLFGPSGSGKSSILAAVAGLLRPAAGRVALDGAPLTDTARGVFLPPERRRCATVFQEGRLFPHLSVASNLRYGLRRAPRGAAGPGFAEVVALLGLEALLERRPARLSGGEKQRVALGRALLARPRLLLLDEPLAALDAPRRQEVLPFLEALRDRAGLPMLYVTHALDEADRLADTLVLLEAGQVRAAGPLAALTARTDLPLLAARRDAGVVLPCHVAAQDPAAGLTLLDFPGGRLRVSWREAPLGQPLRLRVRARDVAVALPGVALSGVLSTGNALPATLRAVERRGDAECFLRLAVGESTLLARVTREAVARLGLRPGQAVVALVSAVSAGQG
ncbi:molybdenum ABC transporter ATP-binding protein [Pseudoroseomonas rhizosphaerae]|uniref:Molybdenum ABC transporter ATP-binding protein n=1 Tax=Teichococcus rhizosphaerae TaxID=1335062 RepID=A0A2C7ACD3_9PROT|nr:molybdenum ABC transporter ATP-binding protein [Pseudoroseomonas rhizosphaerae]PHK94317.1 molybdenum ABC transporter ATP-binding protein [Pseudoroseomonas rhizosphaerae]